MARIGQIWTGLLKAGALALVLALFGLSTASAHGASHDGAGPEISVHAHQTAAIVVTRTAYPVTQVLTVGTVGCHGEVAVAPAKSDGKDHAPGCRCHDGCPCGCASACFTHVLAGLPASAGMLPMPTASVLLPLGRSDDPAGLKTPPEPRPPLSI